MTAIPVTPSPGPNNAILFANISVIAINAFPNGGYIVNPISNVDQGISTAEVLYVDIVGNCSSGIAPLAFGTISALQPGQTWSVIPGQTTVTYVNANTPGHRFTAVSY